MDTALNPERGMIVSVKQSMVDFLKREYGVSGDEIDFDVEAAIYWYVNDFHTGQWSELYSILSTSDFKPCILHDSIVDEGEIAVSMYNSLIERGIS
jgi:hypothetical protein